MKKFLSYLKQIFLGLVIVGGVLFSIPVMIGISNSLLEFLVNPTTLYSIQEFGPYSFFSWFIILFPLIISVILFPLLLTIWIIKDSRKFKALGVKTSPLLWAIGVFLPTSIIVFPIYLIKRNIAWIQINTTNVSIGEDAVPLDVKIKKILKKVLKWGGIFIVSFIVMSVFLVNYKNYITYGPSNTVETAKNIDLTRCPNDEGDFYRQTETNVYDRGQKVQGADPKTFTVLCGYYAKDKNHAYWNGLPIIGADSKSFFIINEEYAKDNTHVYNGYSIVDGADLQTFVVLNGSYAKDKDHLYHFASSVQGVDLKTLVVVNEDYAKDKYYVYDGDAKMILYKNGFIVGKIDPETFSVFGGYYFEDKNGIYWGNDLIGGAVPDKATFVAINDKYAKENYAYAKDKNHVYFLGSVLDSADPKTFTIIEDNYTKDINHIYTDHSIIQGADLETFSVINSEYSKDKNNVYDYGEIVLGADPKTFIVPKD